ncbi:RING-H2 finger protein ATL51-like [Phragmites australis]|uniref:RING-H2 finger protein ATL51-like n=1 Tax=Phragmites australis TaxID=29695 RepID=UPI002D7739D6|nr:RING-H2 finger protein ATL51-like [Phragmites australis]
MATPNTALSAVLLVAGIALMLVIHILALLWALRRGLGPRGDSRSRTDEERAVDGCGGGGEGLSPGKLDALPCHDYKAADGGRGEDCAVCLEAFEAGDRCRRLPRCEHRFHASCVDSWLRKSLGCPVCRADVVDRSPKAVVAGEAAAGAVEMAERRSPAALEIVAER